MSSSASQSKGGDIVESGGGSLVWVLIAGLVVAGVVLIVWITRKKGK